MAFDKIEITNFRGIKHLSLPDLRRINLFVGKNNCGKSSALDAVFLLTGFTRPVLNIRVNQLRDYEKVEAADVALNFYNMDLKHPIRIKSTSADPLCNRRLEISPILAQMPSVLSPENLSDQIASNQEPQTTKGFNFSFAYQTPDGQQKSGVSSLVFKEEGIEVQNAEGYNETLSCLYLNSKFAYATYVDSLTKIIEEKQEGVIVEILQEVEPKIRAISVLKNRVCVDIGLARLVPINMLGDGIRKLLAIITSLYWCKDGVVLIDEIDNGLHFSSLVSLWKSVVKMAQKLDVQVFATTHNIESLESLNRVISENREAEQDIVCYSLRHLASDELKAYAYPYEKFQYVINQEIEIR